MEIMVVIGRLLLGIRGLRLPARKRMIMMLFMVGLEIWGWYDLETHIAHKPWLWWAAVLGCSMLVFVWAVVPARMEVAAEFGVADPQEWECVSPVEPDNARGVIQEFENARHRYEHMYPVRLRVLEVHAVSNDAIEEGFLAEVAEMQQTADPNIHQLYHGTSAIAAKEIVTHGFALPNHDGIFGKGIYFADNPLKSWQYSTTGYMLVCDVALGRERQMRSPEMWFC